MSKYKPMEIDITGDIGDLFPKNHVTVTMYSYSRPAAMFWQGVYDGMRKLGKTHEEALEILQSKASRWMLDQEDHKLYNLGKRLAKAEIEKS